MILSVHIGKKGKNEKKERRTAVRGPGQWIDAPARPRVE